MSLLQCGRCAGHTMAQQCRY